MIPVIIKEIDRPNWYTQRCILPEISLGVAYLPARDSVFSIYGEYYIVLGVIYYPIENKTEIVIRIE